MRNARENLAFSTLILGSVFSDYVVFYGDRVLFCWKHAVPCVCRRAVEITYKSSSTLHSLHCDSWYFSAACNIIRFPMSHAACYRVRRFRLFVVRLLTVSLLLLLLLLLLYQMLHSRCPLVAVVAVFQKTYFTYFSDFKKHDFLRFFELLNTFSRIRVIATILLQQMITTWRSK